MFQGLIFQHIRCLGIKPLSGGIDLFQVASLDRSPRPLPQNSRSTSSMNADRDCFDPAIRSIAANTSPESVIDVFSFILPLYYPINQGMRL